MDAARAARTRTVKQAAIDLGAARVGVAPAGRPADFDRFRQALARGLHADMAWLERTDALAAREHPARLLPGARSFICLAFAYGRGADDDETTPGWGRVARYARGRDYHDLLGERLERLAGVCRGLGGEARAFVDGGPVREVAHAAAAGLGWVGRNTLLIHPRDGSWHLLGEVLTTLELDCDEPLPDRCGSCTRCIDACPTGAFPEPGVLDAARCLSYQTIEQRGALPDAIAASLGDWLFGCDVCQEVCPWNQRFARPADEPALDGPATLDLAELLGLDDEAFRQRFRGTAPSRAKRRGLARNAAALLACRPTAAAIPALRAALAAELDPVVREMLRRALDAAGIA